MTMREYETPHNYAVDKEGRQGVMKSGAEHVASFMSDLARQKPEKVVISSDDPHIYTKRQICRQVNIPLEVLTPEEFANL